VGGVGELQAPFQAKDLNILMMIDEVTRRDDVMIEGIKQRRMEA
jgi:hypothetical protein